MHANATSSPDDIDITTIWGALRKALPRLALTSAAIATLTFVGLSLVDPQFTSEAQLQIGGKGISDPFRDPKAGGGSPDVVTVKVDKEAVNTQVIALQSGDLSSKLIAELKLAERAEFNSGLPSETMLGSFLRAAGLSGPRQGESEADRVLSAYKKRLRVYQGKETRVITIEFSSSDPELAATAANKLASLYQDWLRSQGVTQSTDASEWLRPQIEKLAREVATAEQEVERFRGQTGLYTSGGKENVTLNQQQLTELSTELSKAKGARSEAEARSKAAREMLRGGSADASPDVQKSPNMQALVQSRSRTERMIAELSASLLPAHPRMQQLNSELAGLKRQIATEVGKLVDSLDKEARVAAMREDAVKKSLDEMKTRVAGMGNDEVRLKQLDSLAKAKRKELDALQDRLESARSRSDARSIPLEALLLSHARASSVPTFPKKMPLALLALAGTFLLGLAWIITRELLIGARSGASAAHSRGVAQSHARHQPIDAVSFTQEPLVGPSAPRAASIGRERFACISSITAAARHLADRAPEGGPGFRTLIVEGADQSLAASRACELAEVLAERGRKVLLVDWSPAGNGLSASLGLNATPGIVELLGGEASFEDVIQRLSGSSVHAISGGTPRSAGARATPDRINLILDALDEAYDHIVVSGSGAATRELFEATQGRFDAGILVTDGSGRVNPTDAAPGTFIGYQVTDIEIIRLDRPGAAQSPARSKLQLARSGSALQPAGA